MIHRSRRPSSLAATRKTPSTDLQMAFLAVPAFVIDRKATALKATSPRSHLNWRLRAIPCMVVNRADEERGEVEAQVRPTPRRNYAAITPHHSSNDPPATPPDDSPIDPTPIESTDDPQTPTDETQDPPVDGRLIFGGLLLFAGLAVGGVAAANGLLDADRLVKLSEWVESLGPEAGLLYAAVYFLLELVGVPALPLTMGSGYLFGVAKGTLCVSVASTAAAAAAFLIARYGLRNSVMRLAARYPRFRAMDRAIGREGFRFVFLLRLSPLLPFSISNYLYGLTSVDLSAYVFGSWLGMLPGTIAYVSAGAAVGALTDLSAGKGSVNPVLLVIGLVATVAALSTIGKIATDAIEAEGDEEIAEQR
eukprot:GFKZ01013540.1.p1 GENE.GFKZ01013540.1~~GFKZ01013540.1.p1  ORF type:complete len:364 (+),score=45.96 GFKZ01013540.1:696-1787(+)